MIQIPPSSKQLFYTGRIDWREPEEPVFVFPCTSVAMRFTGNHLKIRVRNKNSYWNNYLGCILDGKQSALPLPKEGEEEFLLKVEPREDNIHEVLLFKRQDSCHELTFLGMEIGEGERILDGIEKPRRRIEVYGDSVSAGEVSEAVDYVGKEDPDHQGEYSNSWYSYAWIAARKLGAQIHDIAQGGIALMDKTGWFCAPDYIGMESVWDKIHYNPSLGEPQNWDFSKYVPQVVIVAIGQNDNHPLDHMQEDYQGEAACLWRKRYEGFIKQLRQTYPDAWIILTTTILNHHPGWDASIEEVTQKLGDEKIRHFMYKKNGTGTPGHIRIPEAEEMAEELSAYIEGLKIEGWN